jgi:hypothetical protein
MAAPVTATSAATPAAVAPPAAEKRPAGASGRAAQPVATATAAATVADRTVLRQHHAFLRRPRATAEAGLGTTVFGILGIIALPIALLGLLLSGGGLVWGIVAGAAALAILVAYLDPFGG